MGSYTQLITVDDRGAMMSFPSIDAVRNLRSNCVRTARLTPPQGYGDAWRCLVQRNATRHSARSNASHSVVDGAPSPGIAGAPRGALHCHSSGDSSGGESGARLQCCALLPQPNAPHSLQIFAAVACLFAAEEALLHAPAASAMCPQGSRLRHAVDAADLQGERALRPEQVRHWPRTGKV